MWDHENIIRVKGILEVAVLFNRLSVLGDRSCIGEYLNMYLNLLDGLLSNTTFRLGISVHDDATLT